MLIKPLLSVIIDGSLVPKAYTTCLNNCLQFARSISGSTKKNETVFMRWNPLVNGLWDAMCG